MAFVVSFGTRYKQTRNVTTRESKYPWAQMGAPVTIEEDGKQVEQLSQFFVPNKASKSLAGLAYATGKRMTTDTNNPVKFSLRNCAIEELDSEGNIVTVKGTLVQRIA